MSELRFSPSQINTYLAEPAIWYENVFLKVYGKSGAGAWRGHAVERGLESIMLHGFSQEEALEVAHNAFDSEQGNTVDPDAPVERERIAGMLAQAQNLLFRYDGLRDYQTHVAGVIEGVLITGKVDFDFTSFMADLKTTTRIPSGPENIYHEHLRQMWIYRDLTGVEQRLGYASEKKNAIHTPTERQYEMAEKEVRGAIRAMKLIHQLHEYDPFMARTLCAPHDFENFRWDERTLDAANNTWQYPRNYQPY